MFRSFIQLIVLILLIVSTISYSDAADSFESMDFFNDYQDDVTYMYGRLGFSFKQEIHRCNDKPNVNIINVTYQQNGRDINITFGVEGVIENKEIEIINGTHEFFEVVMYTVEVRTSENTYFIAYFNRTCISADEDMNISYTIINNSMLSIFFNLNSSKEIIEKIEIISSYLKSEYYTQKLFNMTLTNMEFEYYFDSATNINYSLDIKIIRPDNHLYLFNYPFLKTKMPILIGRNTIKIEELINNTPVFFSELYVDGEWVKTDYSTSVDWNTLSFGKHTITITAFDNYGNRASNEIEVMKFF
jgi:hypothetical protein